MRFIGNKENLLDKIYQVMQNNEIEGKSFFDVFSGTTNVARYFKKLDYQIFSSDLLYFSYVLQKAYIVNNNEVLFSSLLKQINAGTNQLLPSPLFQVVEYLNNIEPYEGFIFNNYAPTGTKNLKTPRMYFTDDNAKIIDAIRSKIEKWKSEKLISESEYYVLLACLIETVPFYSNITGVFAAFQKKWDVRAKKRLLLRPIEVICNSKENFAFHINSTIIAGEITADIFYLDPPYNQRQYAPNYHILETIAKYDSPIIKGITGMRDYSTQKSAFCNAETGIAELGNIAKNARCKTLLLSYNTEGIMSQEQIIYTLEKYGEVKLVEFDYIRFKSNNNGEAKHKKIIQEQLYILQKK